MATLTGQTIATSYEQLLSLPNGGLAGTNLVAITDGDSDTTCALQVATTSIGIAPTHRLYLDGASGGTGHTYINESAADIMDFYSGGTHMLSLDLTNTEVVINEGSADINFRVESNGNANMLFVDGGNNRIGIGTASPVKDVQIHQASSDTTKGPILVLTSAYAASGTHSTIAMACDNAAYDSATDTRWIQSRDANIMAFGIGDGSGTDGSMTDHMAIDANGNVGIGTSSPTEELSISAATNPTIVLTNLDTTINDGDDLGSIYFSGLDGTSAGTSNVGAAIFAEAAEEWETNTNVNTTPTELSFWTSADDTNAMAQRMTIDKDGNVGIGDTSPGVPLVVVGAGDNARFGSTNDGVVLSHASGIGIIQGTDTEGSAYNDLAFKVGGNYAMYIDATNDNVGIGTTSPGVINSQDIDGGSDTSFLHIKSAVPGIMLEDTDISGTDYNVRISANAENFYIEGARYSDGANLTAMTVECDTGKVGIGTTSPPSVLSVVGTPVNDAHTAADAIRIIGMSGLDEYRLGIGWSDTDARTHDMIQIGAVGSSATGSGNGGFYISTRLGTGDSEPAERVRVDENGYVGIGEAVPNSTLHVVAPHAGTYPSFFFQCAESDLDDNDEVMRIDCSADANIHSTNSIRLISIHDNGGEIGYFTTASDGNINTAWTNVSDIRYKKDIVDTRLKGLKTLNKIKVRDFKWNDKRPNIENNQEIGGFVADELYEVYPYATCGTPGGMKNVKDPKGNVIGTDVSPMGVTQGNLMSLLVKAVQELSAKVTALENA